MNIAVDYHNVSLDQSFGHKNIHRISHTHTNSRLRSSIALYSDSALDLEIITYSYSSITQDFL